MPHTGDLSVSVVMPALNEEANVAAAVRSTLNALDDRGLEGEVIVVDDGSTDGTSRVARDAAAQDARVRILGHEKSRGMGAAFWTGARQAQKTFVVMMPGDNENDPSGALKYLPLGREVDVIVPFVANTRVRSLSRRILSWIYRLIINLSFGLHLNYTNGTVLYNRAILEGLELRSGGFFYQTELLVRLLRAGYLFAEVPVFLKTRQAGRAKALRWRALAAVMAGYLGLWTRRGEIIALHPASATARQKRTPARDA